jgi:KDO2-lipid IV(A) lauroyltransferase
VVIKNVQCSFPLLPKKEQQRIVKQFYRYFSFLLAESVKNLSISKKSLTKRVKVTNPEILDTLYEKGESVLLLSAHFYNWELIITSQNLLFKHQAVGIGTPLSNKFWDKKINDRRERFGMKVVHADNYKVELAKLKNKPTATLILGDQSPVKIENSYWVDFLNQPTAFFFGAEIMAHQTNSPVIYVSMSRVKRGYYELELIPITINPVEMGYGEITEAYVKLLEKDIEENKYAWLWSHKRWKKGVPPNLPEIKESHKQRFIEKFKNN